MRKTLILILSIISTFAMCFLINKADLIVVEAAVPAGYYSSTEGKNGDALLNELAKITKNNHKTYTSYGDIRYAAKGNPTSDKDPNNSSNLLDFYSGISVKAAWDSGNTWNREHVWPQSLSGGLYGESGAGADIHHIRPTISSINSSRGNKPFTDFDMINQNASEKKYNGVLVAYTNNTYWEPLDKVKGDTARIIMYMYMHYSKEVSANSGYDKAGNLKITSVIYAGGGSDACWDLLCAWNESDPVDDFEANRNEFCASVTGTRNPFIDNPDFADRIWQGENGGSTPTPETYSVKFNVGSATFNYSDTTKYVSGATVKQPNVTPVLAGHTFVGWYKDSALTVKWNFATDKITNNVTLYAKFEKDKPISFTEIFEGLSIKSQLTFDVEMLDGLPGYAEEKSVTINNITEGKGTLDEGDEYDLAEYMEFDTTLFDISYKQNDAGYSYIKLGSQIRLYPGKGNGSSIEIAAKSGVKIIDVKVIQTSDSAVTPEITIETDGSKAIIQNTVNAESGNQSKIQGFSISYEQGGAGAPGAYNYIHDSLYLNYVLKLSKAEYASYLLLKETIKMYVDGAEVAYDVIEMEDEYRLVYRIKIDDINKVYIPKFTYGQLELTLDGYSGKTLAQFYLDNLANDALVKPYVDCLNQILGLEE